MNIFCAERFFCVNIVHRQIAWQRSRPSDRGREVKLTAMKVNVAQISEDDGLNIHHLYAEGEPDWNEQDSRLAGRTELDVQAVRASEKVRLVGHIKATVEFECDRCLKPLSVVVDQGFDLLYVPPLGIAEEHELGEDDLSIAFYQGGEIDIDDLVREQIELAIPMARLCGSECRGLCPQCGANLNNFDCACKIEQTDPRWGALKGFNSNN